ncbi:hypothetical protein [Prosthecobacter sp.]|uniref:hypothetical protein n=1 Tax=Prosthecobacter sp. TaxID=1965333 RepID=UPI003783E78B
MTSAVAAGTKSMMAASAPNKVNEDEERLLRLLDQQFGLQVASQHQRTTIVIMSEFGRCHGVWPGLANDKLDEHADLAITTDYRQVLSEVLLARMRGAEVSNVFPGFTPGAPLGLV